MPNYEDLSTYLDTVVERALDEELPDRSRLPQPMVDTTPPVRPTVRSRTRALLRRVYTPVAREEILLVQQVDARLNTEWAHINTTLTALELAIEDLRARLDAGPAPGPTSSGLSDDTFDATVATLLRSQYPARPRDHLVEAIDEVDGSGPVLVLGCADADWPAALLDHGVDLTAVDGNVQLVTSCRSKGVNAIVRSPLEALEAVPMQSLRAVTALSLVDTLSFREIISLCEHAFRGLTPGGLLVLEAPDPADSEAALAAIARDPRARRLLHPEVLVAATQDAGFASRVVYLDERHPNEGAVRTYAILARRPPVG